MLALYYEAEDVLSLLYSVDFGLGQTKYDVLVRRYSYHKPMDRKDPYAVIEELGLPDGVPAWPRLRPMNNGTFLLRIQKLLVCAALKLFRILLA